jgi:hypothetical protein
MTRRKFAGVTAAGTAALVHSTAAQSKNPSVFELRYFRLRNSQDQQRQRTTDFLRNAVMPAAQRAGTGTLGFFSTAVGPDMPSILMVSSHSSLAALEASSAKLMADKEYLKALEAFSNAPGLGYLRMETSLLRAFNSMPQIEVPPSDEKRTARVFELRIYESNNSVSLRKKIGMFEDGEIAIFRKTGLLPVFFGHAIAGPKMPNLTYMLAFDDLAAREKNWRAFVTSPEWKKLSATPGLSDAEVVSNISSSILSPLPFSPIR